MTVTKKQIVANKKEVKEYWRSYLQDGHIMGWLIADKSGNVWGDYEPQGQTEKFFDLDCRVVHTFGNFYRAHGEMPEHITLKRFIAELEIGEYLG